MCHRLLVYPQSTHCSMALCQGIRPMLCRSVAPSRRGCHTPVWCPVWCQTYGYLLWQLVPNYTALWHETCAREQQHVWQPKYYSITPHWIELKHNVIPIQSMTAIFLAVTIFMASRKNSWLAIFTAKKTRTPLYRYVQFTPCFTPWSW